MMCRCCGNAGRTILNGFRFALAIFRGKIILIRAMPDSLRAVRHCIFTGRVVEESGICSAGFLRKHPRCGERPHPLRHGLCRATSFSFLSLTRHLLPSLSPTVTFLPGAGRICPDRGKMSPQVTKRGIWHRAAMTERARLLTERARSVKCASTVSGHDPTGESSVWSRSRLRSNKSPSGAFKRRSGLR